MISMYFSKITTTALFEIGGFLKIKAVIFYGRGTILIPTFLIIHSISVSSSPFYFYFRSRTLFIFRVPTLLSRSVRLFKRSMATFRDEGLKINLKKNPLTKNLTTTLYQNHSFYQNQYKDTRPDKTTPTHSNH